MTREEIMQLNTDYLNGCESEYKMNELFNYVLELSSVTPPEESPYDGFLSRKERLKMLMETGEFDFLKDISPDKIWKLVFMLEFIGDTESEE